MTPTASRPRSTAPVPPAPPARVGTGAWVRAVLLTMLAWAALVCTGPGGAVGAASQSLAHKLATNAQAWQRHGGASLTSPALRRDQAALSIGQVAGDSQVLAPDPTAGAMPAAVAGLRIDARRAHEPPIPATAPHPKPRPRAHPNRAPPVPA